MGRTPSRRAVGRSDASRSPLSTPLEVGLRAAFLLDALAPTRADVRRLVILDYLLVHSGDVEGGPPSLHPATPHRAGEILVRRDLMRQGLLHFVARELVALHMDPDGVWYAATDLTPRFLAYMDAPYAGRIREAAAWVVRRFGTMADAELALRGRAARPVGRRVQLRVARAGGDSVSGTATPGSEGGGASAGTAGFFIRRLVLIGAHAPTASLEFRRGLNIVTGPSDTGKSFALQCIDFAFGASDRPKEIPQARTHKWVALEIESSEGNVFTIERSLEGSPVRWYGMPFSEIRPESEYEELAPKHSPSTRKTLSYRLLELCALAGRVVRKNKKNVTRTVSFRNIAKLIVVDEERVISSRSPALGDHKTDETADRSLFTLLLTGGDEAGLVAAVGAPTASSGSRPSGTCWTRCSVLR